MNSDFSLSKELNEKRRAHRRLRGLALAALLLGFATGGAALAADTAPKRWSDADLVKSYAELEASGGLEAAVRTPNLPKDPPQAAFLEALSWYAAGSPVKKGELTMARLDAQMSKDVGSYIRLLKAKVTTGADNDYARTRTWKLIQKLTLLKDEMNRPERKGLYPYAARPKAASGDDAWEQAHTLKSADEFAEKVCKASHARPVLVKYGNTNCTQCMLFELIGSVKTFAESPDHKNALDVYKVWWGFQPDDSFAGVIRNPERLDALAKEEGVSSSPYFIVYRNGKRYPCGDAFPDDSGHDPKLETCLKQEFGDAPTPSVCAAAPAAGAAKAGR